MINSNSIFKKEDALEIPTYSRWPIALESGEGCYVTDTNGKKYLDFYGGHCVALLGHSHPGVVNAIKAQAEKLMFYSNVVYSDIRARAAERLLNMAGGCRKRIFFCNSGTEANETALKIARKITGRRTVVAMTNGFHGRTLGSLSVTWNPVYREPYSSSLACSKFIAFGDVDALERVFIQSGDTESNDIAAVMLEPIQSMAGVVTAPREYFKAIRSLCTRYGTPLIFDEVQTGVGRTGSFLYSSQLGIEPDLTTLAKSLGSGVPVGAVLMPESIASSISKGDHGTTFGGGMLAMAAVEATLEAIESERVMERAGRIFGVITEKLSSESVDVTGSGCLIGIRFDHPVARMCALLRDKSILTGGSSDPAVMRLMPPATATDMDVDTFLTAITEIIQRSPHKKMRVS